MKLIMNGLTDKRYIGDSSYFISKEEYLVVKNGTVISNTEFETEKSGREHSEIYIRVVR